MSSLAALVPKPLEKGSPRYVRRLSISAIALCLLIGSADCGHKARLKPPPAAPPPRAPQARPAPAPEAGPPTPAPEAEAPTGEPAPSPPEAVAGRTIPGPPIRIGLTTTASEIHVTAPGEFFLSDKIPEAGRITARGDLLIRVERGAGSNREIYRVQVASLSRREAAGVMERKLTETFDQPVFVRENAATGTFQVRIGAFAARQDAQNFASGALARQGYMDTMIVRDHAATGNADRPRLAVRGRDLFRTSDAGFLIQPASGSNFLRLGGKSYRGNFDLILNKNGLITVVNQLGMEEYLLGVVPAEMSPSTYPEFQALAAQSIAARTYALKNAGRYEAEGFDLTADVRTQVYGGVAQEREGANDAVRATAGVAIYYQGSLIDSLYTSTCGGRTEDFANVFDSAPVPYLRSVACAVENGEVANGSGLIVEGAHGLGQTLFAEDGSVLNRNIELALLLGIGSREIFAEQELAQPAGSAEISRWISQAARIAGREGGEGTAGNNSWALRADFARAAAERLLGTADIQKRITSGDADYYLSNLRDGAEVPAHARGAVTLLLQGGYWHTFPDNSIRPREPIRRADALSLLFLLVEAVQPGILRVGLFEPPGTEAVVGSGRSISLKWGSKTQQFSLAPELRLYRLSGGRSTPADSLRLIGNEKLRFHLAADGRIDFMEVELNPTGAASDRYSPVATWKVTLTRAEVASRLRTLTGNIGEFRDLKPSRLGASGRAVQVQAIGSRGSVLLNGYKVRSALNIRDTLYTIRRSHDPSGTIESFTFDGRGWGHGIGLCQVGAYGMARAGRNYEEILKTYYQGIELRKAY